MPRTRFLRSTIVAAVLIALFGATGASAQSAADFYKGKRLNLIIASGVGGGYDSYARVLSRHWGKYIPGNPTVVVQNMDGAAGITATNHIANKAERDGTAVLATYNTLTIQPLLDNKGILYDSQTLNWIGSIGKQVNICVTWAASSPIKTLDQAKTTEIPVSSTGATGNSATLPNMINKLIGTNFKVVSGYPGAPEMSLALERGEAQARCGWSWSSASTERNWLKDKKIMVPLVLGTDKLKEMPEVPRAIDFAKTDEGRGVLQFLADSGKLGRPFVAPPNVPADRLAALRNAFAKTMEDEEFKADAAKQNFIADPLSGADLQATVQNMAGASPAVLQSVKAVVP